MKGLSVVLATVGAVIALVVAMPASADVARYQSQAGTLTISLEPAYPGNIHIFDITLNPCDGAFTGTTAATSPVQLSETIVGTLLNGTLDFTSTYAAGLPGYQWFDDGPGHAADLYLGSPLTLGGFDITVTSNLVNSSNWKNHGEYVKSNPDDKNAAAHACLGMPINP